MARAPQTPQTDTTRSPRRRTQVSVPATLTIAYAVALVLAALLPVTTYLPQTHHQPAQVRTLTRLQPAAVTDPTGVHLPAGYARTTSTDAVRIHATTPPCWTLVIPTDPQQAPVIEKSPNLCQGHR